MYIVGSITELGEWDVQKAKKMYWTAGKRGEENEGQKREGRVIFNLSFLFFFLKTGNVWDINVGFDLNQEFQYKYVVIDSETREVHWENIPNRYPSFSSSFSFLFC